MPKIEIEVRLSDEDRALMNAVKSVATKVAATAGGKKAKPAAADDADDFENTEEGDGETEEEGEDEGDGEGEEDTGPSRDDVRDALRAYARVASQADAIKLMKEKGGSDALSKLKEAKFVAVIAAAKKATAAKSKKK